jgi:hypothetical protein|tara:strand:+ start:262 stop:495 length:234 start_codon:yes stop_codon:yes gene_type:complete
VALSAEEKERIMAERGESGRIATGKMRRFSIKFTGEKVTTMLDPQGRNIIDIWESAEGRFGKGNVLDVIVQGEDEII